MSVFALRSKKFADCSISRFKFFELLLHQSLIDEFLQETLQFIAKNKEEHEKTIEHRIIFNN